MDLIPKPDNICCVDVSGNGQVTAMDSAKILRIVEGLEQSPGRCPDLRQTVPSTTATDGGGAGGNEFGEGGGNYGRGY